MKLIVGLGNPGRKYKKTRHNVGFMFVDRLVKDLGGKFRADKDLYCESAVIKHSGHDLMIIKPQTFMNLSGQSVLAAKNYYRIETDDILVVYDDMELPSGKVRIRRGGSSGGHKGMQSIIETLKTETIKRIRIGIGKEPELDACRYVLAKFKKSEEETLNEIIANAKEMIDSFLFDTFDNFMGKYN